LFAFYFLHYVTRKVLVSFAKIQNTKRLPLDFTDKEVHIMLNFRIFKSFGPTLSSHVISIKIEILYCSMSETVNLANANIDFTILVYFI
jgi:hypothetical protein